MKRRGWLMCSVLATALSGCGGDEALDPVGAGGGAGAGGATGEGGATGGGGAGTGGEGGQGTGGAGGSGGADAPALSFVEAGTYPAAMGAGNAAVVADDLDGDGVQDLVIVNPPGGFLSVQGGAGDGTFQELDRGLVTTGSLTGRLAISDLDGDGARDMIATARFAGVLIFAGHGAGMLHPPVLFDAGTTRPEGVVAADLDGDGNDDLIVGSGASPGIRVLKGNGDATFQPPVVLPVGGNHGLVGVAAGDLDGDGLLDVVAADDVTAALFFFKGAAGGALETPTQVPAQRAQEVSLGDLDGDGSLDVVLSGSPFAPEIGVLLNHGDGTFHPLASYPAGNYASAVQIADVDADGAPDLLASDQEGLEVFVLLNAGAGAFQDAAPYAAGRFPHGIAVADLDGDAQVDLAVSNDGPGLSVLSGNGDGTFQAPAGAVLGSGARALLVSDLDGDGALDLALGDDGSAAISVLRGSGGGLFEPAAAFPISEDPLQLAAGHFDGDTLPDLAVAGECAFLCATVETLAGAADGTFQAPVSSYYGPVLGFDAADLDGDGTTDLVVALDETGPLAVMLGNGDGTVSEEYLPIGADAFALADADGDGNVDIVGAVEFVSFVLRGNGDGTFQEPGPLHLMQDLTSDLVTGDFNADGRLDFVAVSRQYDYLTLMLGAADGVGFTPEAIDLNSGRLSSPVAADLDGDGWTDLALIAKGRVTVLLNARGTFVGGPSFAAGHRPSSLVAADVDGDQRLDLIATGYSSNDVTVLLNDTR